MAEVIDFIDKVKRYYKLGSDEIVGITIAALVAAFIISFKDWGKGTDFDFFIGLQNLLIALIITSITFFVHDAGQRLWGLAIGYRIHAKMWSFGLLAGLVVVFVTNGNVWVIAPSGFLINHLMAHRLGWFRYGINYFGQGLVALGGPIACILLMIVIKIFAPVLPTYVVEKALLFNAVYAITSMLPIPPLDGSKVYFGSRMLYAFTMPAIVGGVILMMLKVNVIISAIIAIIFGALLWILYYVFFEQNAWGGPN